MKDAHTRARRNRPAFTLVELIVLAALLVALGLLIAWGVRRTSRVASLKALRDMHVSVEMNGEELTGIRFTNCFLGDDVMIDHVANLGTFQNLTVRNTDVSDTGLQAIPDPGAITSLDLALTGIGDESLKFIGESCPNLTSLDLTATLITDEGLASLTALSKLENLKLAECRLTDKTLQHLVKIESLTNLDLSFTFLSGQGLEQLPKHNTLKELRLSGVSEAAETRVWQLFPKSRLDFASLEMTEPGSQGINPGPSEWIPEERTALNTDERPAMNRRVAVEIPAVKFVQKAGGDAYGNLHISRVNLTSATLSDDDVKRLYPLRMLSNLQVSGTNITDRFSEHLAGFRRLEILQMSRTSVSDETARVLARLPLLRELDLRHTSITDEGMKHIARSGRLLILDVSDTAVTDDGLADLVLRDSTVGAPEAASDDETQKTDPPAGPILHYSQARASLRVLGLSGTQITDTSIDLLLSFPKLQEISIGRTKLSEEGIKRLREKFKGRVRLEFLKFHPAWPVEQTSSK